MARIGIGLIGVGRHGLRYAHHIREDVPDLELVAIARRNREEAHRQAEEFGCRAYDDHRDLLAAPEVDAVAVVVPPALHLEMIEEAARQRRPVLLEKPAAISVEEGRRMHQAVKDAGIPVMVAQTLRYNGVVQTLLREREKIGRLHAVRVSQRFEPSPLGWVDDPSQAGGGILLHTGVHSFDLVRLFSGLEADEVYCRMEKVGDVELENNFSAVIELGRGEALATVSGCRATESRTGAIELAGEKGQLLGDHVLNTAHLVSERTATALPLPDDVPTVRATLEDFARALSAERGMPIPLEEGLRASALALACRRSALEGVRVQVDRMDA
jgi:predicted dehydrogenase